MVASEADFASFRLPTLETPPRDRLGVWRDVLGRTVMRLDVERLPERDYYADLTVTTMPGVRILSGAVSPSRVERTRDNLVADGNDDFGLAINLSGSWVAESRGRSVDQGPGQAFLTGGGERFSITRPVSGSMLAVCVPRKALAALAPNVEDALLRPVPEDAPALRLLRQYIGLVKGFGAAPHEVRRTVVTHIHDLVALAVGASRDGAALARDRGLAAARLHAMKEDVLANLNQPDLSLASIAQRHRMTDRHARRLFERDGSTFSDFLLRHRLQQAHRLLSDPAQSGRSIASIVFGCGFGDISYFNRSFRAAYGATPSDIRAAAKRAP